MSGPIRIFRSLDELAGDFAPCVLTIGNFDGVHAGHRRIFRRVVELSREMGAKPAALTFDPHPTRIVAPERSPKLMTTLSQRCRLLEDAGIEEVLILPFNQAVAGLGPREFVESVLVRALGVRAVVVGDNFRFGHRQAGDTRILGQLGLEYGFTTEAVPAVAVRGRVASSSSVRRLVEAGKVALAARLLERPFALEGRVVSGHGVGSKQTVPTLNLESATEVIPARGVYITRTIDLERGRTWPSVSNVGYRPTFGGDRLSIESYLLDAFDGPRPAMIRVEFLRRVREERTFPDAPALKSQILKDAGRASAYHRRVRKWVKPSARETSVPSVA